MTWVETTYFEKEGRENTTFLGCSSKQADLDGDEFPEWRPERVRIFVRKCFQVCPNPPSSSGFFFEISGFGDIPDHQQPVRCKAPRSDDSGVWSNTPQACPGEGRGEERTQATQPFGFAQGHESFDLAQDPEVLEGPVEWQMMS
jgi:hypothetical protein